MNYAEMSCETFVQELAGSAATPGGGGASALVGALGTALGNMVGSLTLGKKKYAEVQQDIVQLKAKADALQAELLQLIQADAQAFAPLAKAYGLPKETEQERAHKAEVMEQALQAAAEVPLSIMQKCCEAIQLHKEFAAKGSAIAISDVGCGVVMCKAALQAASLNVFINTKAMANRQAADVLNDKATKMLREYTPKADEIFAAVTQRLDAPC